jgi:hypothetical protein
LGFRSRPVSAAGLTLLLALAGCSSGDAPSIDTPLAPVAARKAGTCFVDGVPADDTDRHGRVRVETDLSEGRLAWVPGLNSHDCTVVAGTLDRAAARDLAADINAAPEPPTGTTGSVNCPADDYTMVLVSLHTTDNWQYVQVRLTGCADIIAPGRLPRQLSTAVRDDLRPAAPPEWRPHL